MLELKEQIDPDRLDQGVSTLCPLFDFLKGQLLKVKDTWELHVNLNYSFEIDFVDNIPENTSFEDYVETIASDFIRDFYSGATPLFRICLLQHTNKDYLLVISNKLVLDLHSVDLLLKLLLNNMYYGVGISKEISKRIASLSDIAGLYKSCSILRDKRAILEARIQEGPDLPLSIKIENEYMKEVEGVAIINLLIRAAASCLNFISEDRTFVRYTIPRDYENLLEHSLEATCGNFLMTYIVPLQLSDLSVNYKKMRDIIVDNSIDLSMQTSTDVSEIVPNVDIVFYGNISNDASYYSILDRKSSPLKSCSEVTIEAFIVNDQLEVSILVEKSLTASDELQKQFKNHLLKEIKNLEKMQARDSREFKGLEISKENFNELISK